MAKHDPALAYLDTNAVRDLFRQGTDSESRIRADMRVAVRRGAFEFCTSLVTFQELAIVGKTDWPMYCKITKFLSPLVGKRVIHEIVMLTQRELATPGRRLFGDDRYLSAPELRELHKWSNERSEVVEVSSQAAEQARLDQADLQDLRIQSLNDLAVASPNGALAALREWDLNERPYTQDGWVETALSHLSPQATKPYPFTAVNATSFFTKRIAWQGGLGPEGRAIRASDVLDAEHFAAASYADVFVSSDGPLAEICALIPDAIQPIALLDFAATLREASARERERQHTDRRNERVP